MEKYFVFEFELVEDETVIVEGTINKIDRVDDGVYVDIQESEMSNIEFSRNDDEVMLQRVRDGRKYEIDVDGGAVALEVSS